MVPEISKMIHKGSFLRHPSRSEPGPSSENPHKRVHKSVVSCARSARKSAMHHVQADSTIAMEQGLALVKSTITPSV